MGRGRLGDSGGYWVMPDNLWPNVDHALAYLALADTIPHRTEGEQVLLEVLAAVDGPMDRVCDLGTGDGRLVALVRTAFAGVESVAIEFSAPMMEKFTQRFADTDDVTLVDHNLDDPLPDLGTFDAVVSSLAIHHTTDERKRSLYAEIFSMVRPGGVFANLEHVSSPTPELHEAFRRALGTHTTPDDPSNKLAPVTDQLAWMGDAGFVQVDCLWKWRELALMVGVRPTAL